MLFVKVKRLSVACDRATRLGTENSMRVHEARRRSKAGEIAHNGRIAGLKFRGSGADVLGEAAYARPGQCSRLFRRDFLFGTHDNDSANLAAQVVDRPP